MAEFPSVLTALMRLEGITQAELEQASGIDRTTISRFQRGERIPDRTQLGRLLAAISGDRDRRLELLFAHLRDEAAGAEVAGITDRHYVLKTAEDATPSAGGSLAAEMELIADECTAHDDVREVIIDLATMIRRHRAELIDARGNVYRFTGDAAESLVADSPSPTPPSGSLARAASEEHQHIGQAFRDTSTPPPSPPPTPTPPPPPRAARGKGGAKGGESR